MAEFYNNDLSWDTLARNCHYASRDLKVALNNGIDAYNEWQSFRAGRTNAEIATALSRTETEVAEMDAALSACKILYDGANNVAISQSDYMYSLRKFS